MDYRQQKEAHRPTVLIVEDDVILRSPLAEYLRNAGYATLEAANAAEARAVFAAGIMVDVVFSDVRMAGPMDGLALARWIRRRHPDVRIALTSGGDHLAVASENPAEIFVAKPYHVADIAALIGQLLAATAPSPSLGEHQLSPRDAAADPAAKRRRRAAKSGRGN